MTSTVIDGKVELITNIKTSSTSSTITVYYIGAYNITNFKYFLKDHSVYYFSPIILELKNDPNTEMLNIVIPEFVNNIKKYNRQVEIKLLPNNVKNYRIIFPLNNSGQIIYETNNQSILRNEIYILSDIVENFISTIL